MTLQIKAIHALDARKNEPLKWNELIVVLMLHTGLTPKEIEAKIIQLSRGETNV